MANYEKARWTSSVVKSTAQAWCEYSPPHDRQIAVVVLANIEQLPFDLAEKTKVAFSSAFNDVARSVFLTTGHKVELNIKYIRLVDYTKNNGLNLEIFKVEYTKIENLLKYYAAQTNFYSHPFSYNSGCIVLLHNDPYSLAEDVLREVNVLKFLFTRFLFMAGLAKQTEDLISTDEKRLRTKHNLSFAFAIKICGKNNATRALQRFHDGFPDEFEAYLRFASTGSKEEVNLNVLETILNRAFYCDSVEGKPVHLEFEEIVELLTSNDFHMEAIARLLKLKKAETTGFSNKLAIPLLKLLTRIWDGNKPGVGWVQSIKPTDLQRVIGDF